MTLASKPGAAAPDSHRGSLAAMAVGALGVVYGDIGTSPLYTLKTALGRAGGEATPEVVLGMLSLVVWTLVITTSVKYVAVVMRADNDGEGGILALMSLLGIKRGRRAGVIALGILGAALLYGDGAITPAISVLSALEGLKAPVPVLAPYVLDLSVVVLVGLFALQPLGTARIGRMFGPIMMIWFVAIGVLGLVGILRHPSVLVALDPLYGIDFLFGHGLTGFAVLGGVFLCATGAEALYADMGHFGARPIRVTWYALVLPTLLLNYAGQTALLADGAVASDANPFFELCPPGAQLFLVVLATAATIIASQAIISGVFSMTRQAIQLGLCPRLPITYTSADGYGQIYVGFVNWTLMLVTLGLALAFQSSDNLAAAFGIAVSLTMLLTSVLLFLFMHEVWRWRLPLAMAVAGLFALVDLAFVAANFMKFLDGGWVPLTVAALLFVALSTWWRGRSLVVAKLEGETMKIESFIAREHDKTRVPGTAVYLTSHVDVVPVPLVHNLEHNKILHERIVLLHVTTENIPRVAPGDRIEVSHLGHGFHTVTARYGFKEHPDILGLLEGCSTHDLDFDRRQTSFFIGRIKIVAAKGSHFGKFRCQLFETMHRNALTATEFFEIPPNQVIELGGQVEI